jgi:hypothetical protein
VPLYPPSLPPSLSLSLSFSLSHTHTSPLHCCRDGDPNTRDADDLVGRGVYTWDPSDTSSSAGTRKVYVQLEGRGLFGRLVTQRS